MRILFVSNLYPPHHLGGYELVCQRTADGLRERGHQVLILTSTYGTGPLEDLEVNRALSCAYRPPDYFPDANPNDTDRNAQILASEIRHIQPDVVVLWNLHGLGMLRLYSLALAEAKQVATRLGDYQFWPNWDPNQPLSQEAISVLKDPRLKCAANCRTLGQDLARMGVDPKNIAILHSWVEMSSPEPPTTPPPVPPLRLLWAGRISPHKGLPVAADAAIIAAEKYKLPIRLDIIGQGDQQILSTCLSKAKRAGDSSIHNLEVRHFEPVSRTQLAHLFPEYHAYLAPSVGHETFPMTCVEAMAAGVPVVASRLGGLVEITGGGRLGLLFEPGDPAGLAIQLRRLATDRQLWLTLRDRGRQRVESQFSREASLDRFEAFVVACGQGLSVRSMPKQVPRLSDRGWTNEHLSTALIGRAIQLLQRKLP